MNQITTSRFGQTVCLGGLALLLCAAPTFAQLSSVGTNPSLGAAPVRGTDTAYDPVNNVYLVVGSTAGNDFTPLFGVFVNAAGVPVAAPFQINNAGLHAHFPRAVYSPHVSNGAGGSGGFLVTWHAGLFTNAVRAKIVAYPNRVVSAEVEIPSQTFQEAGPAVAYSPSAQVFLVTWQASDFSVWGARIGTTGQLMGGPFPISAFEPGGGSRDPSVAWNASTNEFGVLYTGWGGSGATTTFARVNTAGTVVRRNTFNVAGGTYITDLAVNPTTGRFVATWFQGGTYGAEIDGNGDAIAKGLVSTTTGTRDGLGLAYNPVSGTFLVAGMGPSFNVWAAELNNRGARTSADTEVTSAGGPLGSYHPRTAANTNAPEWNISFYHNNGNLRDQVVRTSSTGGGPAGSLGAVTSPPPPGDGGTGGSTGCSTPDPFAAIGGGTCINGGWIPGGSSSGGSTGGCSTPSPGTGWTCVSGGWVPPTSGGTSGGSGGCTTPDPFTAIGGGTCVNGGWIPGGSGGGSTGGSTGGCATSSPGTGWTCVNGGWVPPTSGGSTGGSSGGCSTSDPFAAIGGGTCINGGWVYGKSSGGSSGGSGGCSTPDPFAALGGGTCVNGGWTYGSSSGGSSGGCATPDPFTAFGGGVCVNGGWTLASSSCTTPDPFTAMGGGVCLNGGWSPKR